MATKCQSKLTVRVSAPDHGAWFHVWVGPQVVVRPSNHSPASLRTDTSTREMPALSVAVPAMLTGWPGTVDPGPGRDSVSVGLGDS